MIQGSSVGSVAILLLLLGGCTGIGGSLPFQALSSAVRPSEETAEPAKGVVAAGPHAIAAQMQPPAYTGSAKAVHGAQRFGIVELIDVAMESNPTLRVRGNRILSAQTQVKSAKLQFLATPSVSVEGPVTQNDPLLRGNDAVTILRVQQPLWTGGRLTSNLRRAKATVDVAEADLDHERQGVALGILDKYNQWYSSYLKRQAMIEGQSLYAHLESLIQRRIDAGASAESDMLVLQSRVDQLNVSINQMETSEQTAIAALSQYIGGPLMAADLKQESAGPQISSTDAQRLVEQARARSPLLRRLSAEVRVADEGISRARSTLSPEIYLRAQRQYGRLDYKTDEPIDSVYVGVQSQLGAGLSNLVDIQGAAYDRDTAKLSIRSGELALVEQMTTDLAVASTIDARIRNLESAVRSTGETRESWDRQFVAGRKTWLDVMNAAREQMDLKVQLADARATAIVVRWRLRILADGLDSHIPSMKGERN